MLSAAGTESILRAGASAAGARLRDAVERVARTPGTTVLIECEPGLEPGLAARWVHQRSEAQGPWVEVDGRVPDAEASATVSEQLEAAPGGSLFLPYIESLSAAEQARLADALRRRTESGLAGRGARLIAWSPCDLEEEAADGKLLPDLLYRLNVLSLRVPPLRERRDDVPALAAVLLGQLARLSGKDAVPELDEDGLATLAKHSWPGNLLEMQSVLSLALLRAKDGRITASDLAGSLLVSDPGWIPAVPGLRTLREVEEVMIRRALEDSAGNRSRAARTLGIHRQTLYNKLRDYGID